MCSKYNIEKLFLTRVLITQKNFIFTKITYYSKSSLSSSLILIHMTKYVIYAYELQQIVN